MVVGLHDRDLLAARRCALAADVRLHRVLVASRRSISHGSASRSGDARRVGQVRLVDGRRRRRGRVHLASVIRPTLSKRLRGRPQPGRPRAGGTSWGANQPRSSRGSASGGVGVHRNDVPPRTGPSGSASWPVGDQHDPAPARVALLDEQRTDSAAASTRAAYSDSSSSAATRRSSPPRHHPGVVARRAPRVSAAPTPASVARPPGILDGAPAAGVGTGCHPPTWAAGLVAGFAVGLGAGLGAGLPAHGPVDGRRRPRGARGRASVEASTSFHQRLGRCSCPARRRRAGSRGRR